MPANLRPLSTGELLDRTFSMYRTNFTLFFGIFAVPYLIVLALQLVMLIIGGGVGAGMGVGAAIGAMLITLPFFLLAYLASIALAQAATVHAVSSVHLGQSTTIGESLAKVKGKTLSVIWVMFLTGLISMVGFLLLIIPGILFLIRYSMSVPAVVLEKVRGTAALNRSAALTKGDWGRIFVIYVLVVALQIGVGMLLGFGLAAFAGASVSSGQLSIGYQILSQVLNFLVSALIAPILTIALSLVYYDERVRKEAFDIQHMMASLGAAPATGAAATIGR